MAPHTIRAGGAWQHFDPRKAMLVELYLQGREASVECLVTDRRAIPLVVHDKVSVEERPGRVLEHLLVAPPTRFSPSETRALRKHARRAVEVLGVKNMLCHVELRWVDEVGPRILEVNPRIGAGCVEDSIETFTNLRVGPLRVSLILGEVQHEVRRRSARQHAMIFLFAPKAGILRRLTGLRSVNQLDRVKTVRMMKQVGERVGGDTEEGFLASVWMEVSDEHDATKAYSQIRSMVGIEVR
jgi:predicted ATP-grasp superfamily ATP-dependent carboligase